MDVLIALQDVGRLVQNVVEELSNEECSSLVLLPGHVHLVLQIDVVRLEQLVLGLRSLELLLNLLQLVLEEVDQILVRLVVGSQGVVLAIGLAVRLAAHAIVHERWSVLFLLALEFLHLLLQPLDHLLAEMTSLG